MPRYEYACKECNVSWEIEEEIGQAPKTNECPLCEEERVRYYGNQIPNISFGDDGCGNSGSNAMDFHTVKRRYEKHNEKGYDKDSANRFLKRSIGETEDRINQEAGRYKPMTFDYEKMEKDGLVKKLSEKKSKEKVERAKKLTTETYDMARKMGYTDHLGNKLDQSKPLKQQ